MLELLLQKGVDVITVTGEFGNALQAAAGTAKGGEDATLWLIKRAVWTMGKSIASGGRGGQQERR